jgi:hypothetical protein
MRSGGTFLVRYWGPGYLDVGVGISEVWDSGWKKPWKHKEERRRVEGGGSQDWEVGSEQDEEGIGLGRYC